MQNTLETLETAALIAGLDAAIRILTKTKSQLAGGSYILWRKVDKAIDCLDKQVAELLLPDAE